MVDGSIHRYRGRTWLPRGLLRLRLLHAWKREQGRALFSDLGWPRAQWHGTHAALPVASKKGAVTAALKALTSALLVCPFDRSTPLMSMLNC